MESAVVNNNGQPASLQMGGSVGGTGCAVTQVAQFDHLFKIVLVGDSGVGKSNLLSRFTRNTFTPDEKSTIGVEFATKIVTMSDDKRIKAQIWDTAGQERYRAITNAYYRGALGAIILYDVTKRITFENIPRWIRELKEHANRDIALMLVANKIDLADEPQCGRQVSAEQGQALATEFNLPFLEASAKANINVEDAFVRVISKIYEVGFKSMRVPQQPSGVVSILPDPQQKKKFRPNCCKNM